MKKILFNFIPSNFLQTLLFPFLFIFVHKIFSYANNSFGPSDNSQRISQNSCTIFLEFQTFCWKVFFLEFSSISVFGKTITEQHFSSWGIWEVDKGRWLFFENWFEEFLSWRVENTEYDYKAIIYFIFHGI